MSRAFRRLTLYSRPMNPRRKTRQIIVGDDRVGRVRIGGDARISVQTMTAGYTHDIDACVREIERYAAAGVDIVRVAQRRLHKAKKDWSLV